MTSTTHTHAIGDSAAALQPAKTYAGVGGWLYLLGFGLVVTPFALAAPFVVHLTPVFKAGLWRRLITPGDEIYNPAFVAIVAVQIVLTVALSLWAAKCLHAMVTRAPSFPRLTQCFYGAVIAYQVSDLALGALMGGAVSAPELGALAKAAIVAIIWAIYLSVSQRVQATYRARG